MFTKRITYEDFNQKTREKDLYFNLSEAELLELEREYPNGFTDYMKDAVAAEDPRRMHKIIQTLIERGYGEKSPDGEYFMKSPEILTRFRSSAYYSELMMDLFSDEGEKLGIFVSEIMPAKLVNRVRARIAGEQNPTVAQPQDHLPKQSHTPDYPRVQAAPTPSEDAAYQEFLAWKASRGAEVPANLVKSPTPDNLTQAFREPAEAPTRPPHEQDHFNG